MIERKSALERVETGSQETRNGVPIGIVKGYLATWEPDAQNGRYGKPDRFRPGAFHKSIEEHKSRGNRQIRLRDHHGKTVGGFPIQLVKEDVTGLWVEGEVNLDTKQGRELYSLAKQQVLTDFSIGFAAEKDNRQGQYRDIYQAMIGEGSIVDEPKNRGSNIVEVKSATHDFIELQLATSEYEFKSEDARKRVLDMPYRIGNGDHAFLCGNSKYLIADVVDGELRAVPQAIRDVALELKEMEDQTDVQELIIHAERYLARMNAESPFEESHFYNLGEVKEWDNEELERKLRDTGLFSKAAARYLVRVREDQPEEDDLETTDGSTLDALSQGFTDIAKLLRS